MIYKNNENIGFIYKNNENIDKIYKNNELIFEQGFTREQTRVPPITTTYQAIGKNLKDYKIYGNSVQGKLPSEYQQVEYIESSGTQYIDTGYKYVANDKIEIEIMPLEENADRSIFGAYEMTSTLCELGYRNNLLRGNIAETNSPTYTINQKYKVQLVNGTWQYNNSNFGQTRNNNVSINCYLFARNNNGSVNKQSKEKVYSLKIIRNDNVINEFVPCYRKSDNEPGMYNKVNGVFYTNAGTGEFTVGANAPTPSAPVEIESVGDLITDTNDINYGKYKIPVIVGNTTTNIYLDEPLRKVGDYSDYIDFKNQKEFRNVIVNDDTGTQTIENSYTGTTDSSGTSISLPNIPTIKGTTIFEIDTEIQPSSMYIKYKGK